MKQLLSVNELKECVGGPTLEEYLIGILSGLGFNEHAVNAIMNAGPDDGTYKVAFNILEARLKGNLPPP